MRKNGFSLPLSAKQIVSYLGYLAYGTCYNLFIVAQSPASWRSIEYLIFNALFATSISCHLFSSFIDPADPLIYTDKVPTTNSFSLSCSICNKTIQFYSRHCVICNKCVAGFDHHCAWINNCIGSRNHKSFLFLIISTVLLAGFIAFGTTTAIVSTFNDQGTIDADNIRAELAIAIGLAGVAFSGLGYFGYIVGFHLWLKIKGVSAYDYFRKKRATKAVVPSIPAVIIEKNDTFDKSDDYVLKKQNVDN
jgi:hypothetical protein